MENNFKKENKMSSYRNKSILLCIITFLIGFMFLDFGKRDNSKEVENMKFSLESVEAQVYKKESEKSSLESQIENLKKNISNLESELSDINSQISTLEGSNLSFTDAQELQRLKDQRTSLENNLSIQEQLLKAQEKVKNDTGFFLEPEVEILG